jgi:hypothetical protein
MFKKVAIHPLLISAYAVLYLYASNISELAFNEVNWSLLVKLFQAFREKGYKIGTFSTNVMSYCPKAITILPIPQHFVLSMLPTVSKQIRCYHRFCV